MTAASDQQAADDDRYLTRRETQDILEKDQDRFLSRREADLILAAYRQQIDALWDGHRRQHENEATAVTLQLKHHELVRVEHEEAHDRAHLAHEKIHSEEQGSVAKALASSSLLAETHDRAHDREHSSHGREHELDKLAIDKAEKASDQRFSSETALLETMRREIDRRIVEAIAAAESRYEENRKRIETLEKGDVKSEGKSAGLSVAWAVTLGAIGAIGGVIGIVFAVTRP